eukprot:CAMPEP_0184329300 /NCGR_PEP_ID=MMETSP1049-20130417/144076_1 /TAXON_ID=77928 /ORGANISM="Proteomonas sulcata, Strain CCMP704" /LENGTH=116 /DNA_ID=CAMNT_0026651657 /DNA_START=2460 /DNA_END=2806 /DNA_ORIENTATION=-
MDPVPPSLLDPLTSGADMEAGTKSSADNTADRAEDAAQQDEKHEDGQMTEVEGAGQAEPSEEEEGSRRERWAKRVEAVRGWVSWLAPKAKPAAEVGASIAKKTGSAIGWGIKTGGT